MRGPDIRNRTWRRGRRSTGEWNQYNFAPPASHHTPWAGHWATDYYQYSGVEGKFWTGDPNGGNTWGYLPTGGKGSSCSGNAWAGWAYKFDLRNAQGTRGWYLVAHVSSTGMFDPYELYEGSTIYDGTRIGWVAFWGSGAGVPAGVDPEDQCYAVNYDVSNHWHVEVGQSIGSGHYACYYNYPSSHDLYAQDWLGLTGANTSTWKGSC